MRLPLLVPTICALVFTGGTVPLLGQSRPGAPPPTYELRNGHWYDGERFVPRTMYAVERRFSSVRPPRVDRVLDLRGGHVLPPFAEAHNHNLGNTEAQAEEVTLRYLEAGVFYVRILSNLPRLSAPLTHHFNHPGGVDVQFANGPLTASGGHPVLLRERLVEHGAYPGFTKETLPGQGYFIVDDSASFEGSWPDIASFRPDVLKVMLVHSEDFAARRDDPEYYGRRGLDPALLPLIVSRAHRHRLRVSAHVESAADFATAIRAGVDDIAHLPGFSAPVLLSEEDARLARERDVVVVTTVGLAQRLSRRPELYREVRAAQAANLRLLERHGVRIAIGSDEPGDTSVDEVFYIRELGVFDDRTLLRMWTELTPRLIFPDREVGALADGYEASFVALDGNPLEDFAAVRRIRLRFKQGEPVEP